MTLLADDLGTVFTYQDNTYAFSWPLANFADFPLAKKNHIFYKHINIAFQWLSLTNDNIKKPGKARRAKKSPELPAFLAFPCFFTS